MAEELAKKPRRGPEPAETHGALPAICNPPEELLELYDKALAVLRPLSNFLAVHGFTTPDDTSRASCIQAGLGRPLSWDTRPPGFETLRQHGSPVEYAKASTNLDHPTASQVVVLHDWQQAALNSAVEFHDGLPTERLRRISEIRRVAELLRPISEFIELSCPARPGCVTYRNPALWAALIDSSQLPNKNLVRKCSRADSRWSVKAKLPDYGAVNR
jgi:hypothetical protein